MSPREWRNAIAGVLLGYGAVIVFLFAIGWVEFRTTD